VLLGAEADRAVFAVTGLQGHPEFTDAYMKADLEERIQSGGLPKEIGEEALRDLRENPVSKESWQDMQVGGAPSFACSLYVLSVDVLVTAGGGLGSKYAALM